MKLSDVERLVAELLATGQMNSDTQQDLYRILAEARSNRSYPDDLRYLRDLHTRILPPERAAGDKPNSNTSHASSDRSAALQAQVMKLQRELDQANRKIAELESRPPASADGRKFREIKNRFARRYHPNSLSSTGIEAIVRTEIFKEFWADFEEVEARG